MHSSIKALNRFALLVLMASGQGLAAGSQIEREVFMRQHACDMRSSQQAQAHHRRMRLMHQPAVDPAQAMQMRLDRVASDLHLKPDQQAPWDALRTHLISRAQTHAERIKARRAAMAGAHQASSQAPSAADQPKQGPTVQDPDQAIESRAQGLREQARQLEQTAALMRALYDKLSPEQRTIMRLHREQRMARLRAWHLMRMPMQRGGMEDTDRLAGLPSHAPMLAMLEMGQALDANDALDEALSVMPER